MCSVWACLVPNCEVASNRTQLDRLFRFPGQVVQFRIEPALSVIVRCIMPMRIGMADSRPHTRSRDVRYEYASALDILTQRCRLEDRTSKSLL